MLASTCPFATWRDLPDAALSVELRPPAVPDANWRGGSQACLTNAARGAAHHATARDSRVVARSAARIARKDGTQHASTACASEEIIRGDHQAGEHRAILEAYVTVSDDDPLPNATTHGDIAKGADDRHVRATRTRAGRIAPVGGGEGVA